MKTLTTAWLAGGLLWLNAALAGAPLPPELADFNAALSRATLAMDNSASMALWDPASGVSLLPESAPLIGTPAIADMLAAVAKSLPGAHMQSFELGCHLVSQDAHLATEWCDEHQVVVFPDGRPTFDGRGRMLLVLRRSSDHHWRLLCEMWQASESPASRS